MVFTYENNVLSLIYLFFIFNMLIHLGCLFLLYMYAYTLRMLTCDFELNNVFQQFQCICYNVY